MTLWPARKRAPGRGVNGRKGPLAKGWPKDAPYDFILIDGAVEQVPQAIVDQAADGGRDRASRGSRTA